MFRQLGPVSDFMINSYCTSLDDLFGQLVYYGILKEEDAQCFRVEATVEQGSFVIAAGAAALALLNTYVMKAVIQYFRDAEKSSSDELAIAQPLSEDEISYQSDTDALSKKIRPVPVLFTDKFRWLFVREDAIGGSPTVVQVTDVDAQSAISSVTGRAKYSTASQLSQGGSADDISVEASSSLSEASSSTQIGHFSHTAKSTRDTRPDNEEARLQSYLPKTLSSQDRGEPIPTNFEYMMDTLLDDDDLGDESSA